MKLILRALAALFVAILVSGCGQSGKLYVPGNPGAVSTAPSVDADPGDEKDDETEEEAAAN